MDFEKILWISTLIFFNTFCVLGIFLVVYLFVLLNKISRHAQNLSYLAADKLESLQEGIENWSWLILPASTLLGSFSFGRKRKKKNKFGKIIKDLLE